jgi:hypothetical protein
MTVLLFVHGTGVRTDGYTQTLENIKKGMAARTDIEIVGVPWGVTVGTKVTDEDISSMLPSTAGKGVGLTDAELEAQRWAALLDDPLFELRLLALRTPGKPMTTVPGQPLASEALKLHLRAVDLRGKSPVGGLQLTDIKAAAKWLADGDGTGVLTAAANAAGPADDPELVLATARAVVAQALRLSRGEVGAGPDALYLLAERKLAVEAVRDNLSAGAKGVIGDWLKNQVTKFAEARATNYGNARRSGLMTAVSPGVGDILKYLRRPDEFLALLTQELKNHSKESVYVIGHSLGGIFLVDLLSARKLPPNVTGLITVGSQSPLFRDCDAMGTLRRGTAQPIPFTPWLNIYDRNDFLSFCATRVFGSVPGIEDFEVSSGVSFPDSHGAYWRLNEVYSKISDFCK